MRPSLGQQQRPRCGGRGGEMHLERALVTGTGGVPLPAAEAVAGLGSSFLGRWARGLGSIMKHPKRGRGNPALRGGLRPVLQPRLLRSHWHEGLPAHGGGEQRSVGSVPGSLAGCRARRPSRQPGHQQLQSATPVRRSRGLAAKLVLQRLACDHRSAQESPGMSQQRHRDPQRIGL